jgi:acyl carrier protein
MADIVDVDDIATDESFFDVGGNSFAALTLISRIQQASGVTVSLLEVVRQSTPEGLSDLIRSRFGGSAGRTGNGAGNQ